MAIIINGKTITDEVIEEEFESIKEHYISAGKVVCCDRDVELMGYARDTVINRVLLEQASLEKFGEVSEGEVDVRFTKIFEEHGGEKNFYENTGFNKGDEFMLRRKVKSSLMVDRYLESEMGAETEPTEAELKAYYEANIDRYLSEVKVEVSQLFLEPKSHEAAKESFEELFAARKEMLAGADFIELAKKHSGLEADQINMGFIRHGQNMPEIDAIVFSMVPGEISPVLATPFGFHIFKVTGRQEPAPIPMAEIKNLEQTFWSERREKRIKDVIDRLKAAGSIEEIEVPIG